MRVLLGPDRQATPTRRQCLKASAGARAVKLLRRKTLGCLLAPRRTTTWSALDGETLISLSSGHPHQQLIDKHLAKAGVKVHIASIVNLLDTQIALVEADEGIAIIPSFGMPACRNRNVVMSQLINPVVRIEFHLISSRGRELPPGADEFTSFLKSYIATWAGRAGVL